MRSPNLPPKRLEAKEAAGRAICKLRRLPEDALIDGRPLWECFMPEVDAVLEAIDWKPTLQSEGDVFSKSTAFI